MDQEEATMNIDMDHPILDVLKQRKKKQNSGKVQEPASETAAEDGVDANEAEPSPRSTTSLFDFSVENHFKAVDTISKLCGEPEDPDFDPAEIDRLTSSITFLREWRHFKYPSRTMRFACQNESKEGKDVVDQISLPQFSSATVPKIQNDTMEETSSESCKDYVMYVGGPVWALDWCPRVNLVSDSHIRTEFIAVAAHPPESSYHRMGASLSGRGVIQIWCLLNDNTKEHNLTDIQKKQKKVSKKPVPASESDIPKRPRGRPRKYPVKKVDSNIQRRPRGRPRKNPVIGSANVIDSISEEVQPLDIQSLDNSPTLLSVDVANPNNCERVPEKDSGLEPEVPDHKVEGEICKFSSADSLASVSSDPDFMRSKDNVIHICDTKSSRHSVPKDVSLPRMVFCLAHNGKVAWDVKWRPSNVYDTQRMGYLAVLLGNGALEVWEVPFPQTVKVIYSRCQKEGTDPRFIKLEPVFRCSALKCGDRQSIPLTLEWSSSSPHDMIVAGCHDGVVALWKFSSTGSSVDTRPLLCFSADTVPIRALSWAPVESYSESANVIVTAGHKGLKFWDIRDPFHPLWDFPLQKIIYSLDWLKDPSCVVASVDDGSIRFLSLLTTSNDIAVTGTPFVGTALKGFHIYSCSSFPIWSIQASKLPGFIAYCTADGTALHFQLTAKAVEKDPTRHRAPHFLCGSLIEEASTLTVFTPLPNTPFSMKKSSNEGGIPRSIYGLVTKTNQEKRGKEKIAQDQTSSELPASCEGNELGLEFGSDDTMVAQKRKQAANLKPCSKKKSKADELDLACEDGNPESFHGERKEVEEFPPKIVAMHRVRWNLNQGSENWLCFGGAAGILRCQEISLSNLE